MVSKEWYSYYIKQLSKNDLKYLIDSIKCFFLSCNYTFSYTLLCSMTIKPSEILKKMIIFQLWTYINICIYSIKGKAKKAWFVLLSHQYLVDIMFFFTLNMNKTFKEKLSMSFVLMHLRIFYNNIAHRCTIKYCQYPINA